MPRIKIKDEIFLDKFTEEMILNTKRSKSKHKAVPVKKEIKEEKINVLIEQPKPAPVIFKPMQVMRTLPPIIRPPAPVIIQPRPIPQKVPLKTVQFKKMQEKTEIKKAPDAPKPMNLNKQQKPVKKQDNEMPVTNIPLPREFIQAAPGEIDFGRIIFLIQDTLVTQIEAPGQDKNVIIKKAGHTLRTQITLSREEIINIIKSFSEIARIPLVEGMLVARVSNLEISAVVSAAANEKVSFIVRKEPIPNMNLQPTQLMRQMMPTAPMPQPRPIPFVPSANPT